MREIVIPGEKLAEGAKPRAGFGAYRKADGVYSYVYGLADKEGETISVVPLSGKYLPCQGDKVIGVVEALRFDAAFIELNSPYKGYLPLEGERLKAGDVILVDIATVNEVNKVDLERPMRLYDGKLIDVSAVKVPRIVGHNGSMLNLLRTSGATLFVGRNGRIYIKGDPEKAAKVEKAIRMIEELAHTSGLTDKVKAFLEEKVN
jgi:exosome complex component RRP4